jgi:hypothetical protein
MPGGFAFGVSLKPTRKPSRLYQNTSCLLHSGRSGLLILKDEGRNRYSPLCPLWRRRLANPCLSCPLRCRRLGCQRDPHFVNGVCGRPLRIPFVRLRNSVVSSPATNVVWGWLSWLVAYLLFLDVGPRYLGSLVDTAAAAGGMLLIGLIFARTFTAKA